MAAPSYVATFIQEAEDLLGGIEAAVLALEGAPGDRGLIDQLFRAFHTLKGSAGVAGMTAIAQFTHHVESALDGVRSGAIAPTPALVSAVLAAKDHVAQLLAAATSGGACDPVPRDNARSPGDAIVGALAGMLPSVPSHAGRSGSGAVSAPASDEPSASELLVDYLVTFTPSADPAQLAALDIDPAALVDELRGLGACSVLAGPALVGDDGAPSAPWQFVVTTSRGENAIHDVFIFIAGAGELGIERGFSEFMTPAIAPGAPPPVATDAPAAPSDARRTTPPAAGATVRVASDRLDHLVKLIGELVITQSRLQQVCSLQPSAELLGPVEAFERLIGDLRDSVLGLRMVPIGTMFTRFHRLVRDLSAELDKEVQLVTTGDDTELDKTVIDQLGDAVVHILRNSMDHGIEPAEDRVAAGKPRNATLRLTAAHEGTHVVLTISDDGRGIDLAAVRRKAEAEGLVAPGEVLSEQETIALITRPGFSTAAEVTQLSGRGVGMDVVVRSIEGLRGSLAIASRAGAGTEIRLTLPLTLAIIDGLLVEIERDRFIVPMAAVTENLELTRADRSAHNGRNVVAVRGELVPYIRLRDLYQLPDDARDLEKIVVVSVQGERVGLVVDRVIGSHQTVIQPLGQFYRGIDLFSGTTIMGDGRVAMILDLTGTVRSSARIGTASALANPKVLA